MGQLIYLDYNATRPLLPQVERAVKKNLSLFGNPSSLYQLSRHAHNALETARGQVAECLHTDIQNVIFTGSGTEGNNHVLMSHWVDAHRNGQPFHGVISSIEHACVRNTAQFIRTLGGQITELPVDAFGLVNLDALSTCLSSSKVDLISVMMANNEVGTLQPMAEIVRIAALHGVPVHTDAVQALGKIPISFSELGVDFLTLSGHKIGAPKGVGAVVAKRPDSLIPLLHGGPQEKRHRAGTENTLGITAFGVACECFDENSAPLFDLTERFWDQLSTQIPNCVRNGHPTRRLPNTLNVSFLGVKAHALVMNLDLEGIAVSTGSACSTGSIDPSHVLVAMGVGEDRLASAVRFSLGPETTAQELDQVVAVLQRIVGRLR